jgi:hypothetical protein
MSDVALDETYPGRGIACANGELGFLMELCESGMMAVRALKPHLSSDDLDKVGHAVNILARASGVVRLGIILQGRVPRNVYELTPPLQEEERWSPPPAKARPSEAYVETFRARAREAIDREAKSEEDFERLLAELEQDIDRERAFDRWDTEEMGLTLRGVLADMGVWPDFDHWDERTRQWNTGPMIRRRHQSTGEASPADVPAPPPASVPASVPVAPQGMEETFEPGFKEALRDRVWQVIDTLAGDDEEFARYCVALDVGLARDQPWMYGGHVPLHAAVEHVCNCLSLYPDWRLWQGDVQNWRQDPPAVRRREVRPPPDRA